MLNLFFFFIADIIEVVVVWLAALAIRIFEGIMTVPASIWKLRLMKEAGPDLRLNKARTTLKRLKRTPKPLLLVVNPLTLLSLSCRFIKLLPRQLGFHWVGEKAALVIESWFILLVYVMGHDAIRYKLWDSLTVPMMIVHRQATAVEIFPYRSMDHEPDYGLDICELVPLNEALSFFSDYIFTTFLYYAGYFTIGMYILDWQKALTLAVGDNKYVYSGVASLVFELHILLLPRSDIFCTVGGPTALRFFRRRWWRIGPWKRRRYIRHFYRKKAFVYSFVMINVYGDSSESSLHALYWYFWPKFNFLANPEVWSLELTSGAFPLF